MTYSEKLKDPRWIKLAQLVKEQHGNRCDGCGAMGNGIQLDAHHKRYRKGLDPWEYNKFDIAVLCRDCHGTFHKNKERFDELMTNHILYFEWEADQAFKIMEYLLNKVQPDRFRAVLECIVENFKNTDDHGF